MTSALAIETSGRTGSVALATDGRAVASESFEHGLQNAAKILPIIDGLCRAQGWTPCDLEHVYVSIGPGSFTGLRVGVTIAKTLSLATGAKLVAVPSTRVLVENAPPEATNVIIVLDAKRGHVFTARYERGADGWTEREPAHLAKLSEVIARSPRPAHLIGEGIPYHTAEIDPADGSVVVTPESTWRGSAEVLARLGYAMSQRGEFTGADRMTPHYIRLPEAEEKRLHAAQKSPV